VVSLIGDPLVESGLPDLDESPERQLRPFDFRSPTKMSRDQVRRLEVLHETFQRTLGARLSSLLRTMMRIELLAIDQVSYDEYVRSMPNPTVIGQITLRPLNGIAVIEMGTATSSTLIDRLLGGIGKPGPVRRPTELEEPLLRDLFAEAGVALAETFEPLVAVDAELLGLEFNPNFAQVMNPSEMVAVLSYSVGIVQGHRSEGLLTLCYPLSMLTHAWEFADIAEDLVGPGTVAPTPLRETVPWLSVPVAVRLRPTAVKASDIAGLRVGDVVRFDHRTDEPALGIVGDQCLFEGRIGRTRDAAALEITTWRAS